jgi:AraC family transcriptional regulator
MRVVRGQFYGTLLGRRQCTGFLLTETACRSHEFVPEHCHELAYVSFVLRGCYAECYCGKTWEHKAGQLIFHAPGESHWDRVHEDCVHFLNLEIPSPQLDRLKHYGVSPASRMVFESGYVIQLGRRLHRELQKSDPASALALEGLSLELLAEVFRPQAAGAEDGAGDWLSRVMEILRARYNEPLTLGELGAQVDVHPVSIARGFRKRYLCSVGEYVRQLRIEAACREILNSDVSIAEIAARTGFFDQSHLCRMVRQYTGMSPTQLRATRLFASRRILASN